MADTGLPVRDLLLIERGVVQPAHSRNASSMRRCLPLPERLTFVATCTDTPHGVGIRGLALSWEIPKTPSSFQSQQLTAVSLTLGSTPVGGTNCTAWPSE